jgi:hypothetical protein
MNIFYVENAPYPAWGRFGRGTTEALAILTQNSLCGVYESRQHQEERANVLALRDESITESQTIQGTKQHWTPRLPKDTSRTMLPV